jgi:hypothetical protein
MRQDIAKGDYCREGASLRNERRIDLRKPVQRLGCYFEPSFNGRLQQVIAKLVVKLFSGDVSLNCSQCHRRIMQIRSRVSGHNGTISPLA